MRGYFSRWCYWWWYVVELRQRHRHEPLLTLLISLWEGNVLFKQLCENVLNQGAQKLMAHVTLSLSPVYNLKAHSCWVGNVYQLIYTSTHHLEQYLQISKYNSNMSGCTTWYSLVRRCQLSQPCRVRYGGQHIPKINANS